MLRTTIILIFTLIVVPIICFNFTQPISDIQYVVLVNSSKILLGVFLLTFIVGELTNNKSQVDKLWSIVPLIYAWFIAYSFDYQPRLILMAALVTLWGARLTYNFGRRGGYSWKFWTGEEDYRWEILRNRPPINGKRLPWTLFNLFFITGYQNVLIFLFTIPILAAALNENTGLTFWDYGLAVVFIFFVIYETIADQQQWNYQKEKHRLLNANEPLSDKYKKGFTHKGLWGISRHPNYFAEQSIWVVFYFFQ